MTIYQKKYWPLQPDNTVMTPNGNMYAPSGLYRSDYTLSSVAFDLQALFVHEMVHVWQYQLEVLSVRAHGVFTGIKTLGDYLKAYKYDLDPSKDLLDYSMEAQAAIIEDYYRKLKCRNSRNPRKTRGSRHSRLDYEQVLLEFISDPEYARGYSIGLIVKTLIKVLISIPLLIACQEVYEISTRQTNNQILFDMGSIIKKYPGREIIVRTLEVVKVGCEAECIKWSITGDEDSESVQHIAYGKLPLRMRELISAHDLDEGHYTLSGTVWLLENKDVIGPITVIGNIDISMSK